MDGLISERPQDPYFQELKGQMLFENGHVAEAIPPYRRAVELLPDNALLHIELGQVRASRTTRRFWPRPRTSRPG